MKETIRSLLLSHGADVCGFAAIGDFSGAPAGFSPADLYPACKSVIAFGVALPRGVLQVDPRYIYGHFNDGCAAQVDRIAFSAANALERTFAMTAVPVPCDGPYDFWDAENLEGRGLMSMKHAAVLAGLGTLGKSTLLIHRRFGNRLTLGAILTDRELSSDPPAENLCPPTCRRCLDACPAGAISTQGVSQKLCRPHAYGRNTRGFATVTCNACRNTCPRRYGEG